MKGFLIFAALLVFVSESICEETVTVSVPPLGEVTGSIGQTAWTKRSIYQFYSLQYAESPTGSLRFMPPVPLTKWTGVYNATQYRKECPQFMKWNDLQPKVLDEDPENCLTLDIFSPRDPRSLYGTLLPVMVMIHGGLFFRGSSAESPPQYLLEQDIILVAIQYRIGPLGFFSLGTDGIAGNAGMMDQVEALTWINKHIKYFGGNNSRVTVSGHSAGAVSASMHLMSPMVTPNLFQQVIIQSGSVQANWAVNEDPVPLVKEVYAKIFNTTGEVAKNVMEQNLKSVDLNSFYIAVNEILASNPNRLHSNPVVQTAGKVKYLAVHPRDLLKLGMLRRVPCIAGVVKHEGSYLVARAHDFFEKLGVVDNPIFLRVRALKEFLNALQIKDDSNTFLNMVVDQYFHDQVFERKVNITFKDMAPGLVDLLGTIVLKAPTFNFAKTNALLDVPTYLYTFDYVGEYTRFGYEKINTTKYPFFGGVHHSDELLYLYPFPYTTDFRRRDTRMAKMMVNFFASFVIDGKPKLPNSSPWPRMLQGRNGPYLHISLRPRVENNFVRNEYTAATNERYSLILNAPRSRTITNTDEEATKSDFDDFEEDYN